MMFGLVEIIILLVAVAGSGAMAAILMWLIGRIQKLENGLNAPGDAALLAELQDEVQKLNGAVERLSERTEFAERLLEGKTGNSEKG